MQGGGKVTRLQLGVQQLIKNKVRSGSGRSVAVVPALTGTTFNKASLLLDWQINRMHHRCRVNTYDWNNCQQLMSSCCLEGAAALLSAYCTNTELPQYPEVVTIPVPTGRQRLPSRYPGCGQAVEQQPVSVSVL